MVDVAVSAVVLVGGVLALWVGARWLVDGASQVARAAGVSPLLVGLTVVAFGTSAPELVVSVLATVEGRGAVAVGNVVGSNVFNLGVVLGATALVSPVVVHEELVRRDAVVMAGATAAGTLVLANRTVGRLEGGMLVAALVAYFAWLGVASRRERDGDADGDRANGGDDPSQDPATGRGLASDLARLLVGLALVVVGGRALVASASTLALAAGVSEWVIGVTLVAAGTSLPELVTSAVAARRGEVAIAAGNVVGSNVFNLLGVLGVAALVSPLRVTGAALGGVGWMVALTAVATLLLATGRRITRGEGAVLLGAVAFYWIRTVWTGGPG